MYKFLASIVALAVVAGAALWMSGGRDTPTLSLDEAAEQVAESLNPDLPSFEAIPQSDLPPEGTRSLFDHIIKENGALPFPFERVIELLGSYDRDGRTPVNVLIPDGRSLLKGESDFHRPRIIVSADARPPESDHSLAPMLKGRMFLGFVEDAAEIEVISYNDMAGRFEFQLVKDYREGGVPSIGYAKRAICMTCHQGRSPIFSVRPWEETNGQPQIGNRIAEANGLDSVAARTAEYQGVPILNKLASPETIDNHSDIGNVIPTLQRIWIDGCGLGDAGVECRRQMLSLAVEYLGNPGAFSESAERSRELLTLQARAWPANGIALNNNDLQNRNPLAAKGVGEAFRDRLRGLWKSVTGGNRAGFEDLPPLDADVDPLTPRGSKKMVTADEFDGVYALAQMFSSNDRVLLEKKVDYKWQRVVDAVDLLEAEHLGPQPFRRVPMMYALLEKLGVTTLPASCCISAEGMSEPLVDGAPPLEITEGSVLEVYETYCFACHRGNPSARLDFMNGKTEAEVLQRIEDVPEIHDVLDYERYLGSDKAGTLMPPATSYQRKLLDKARNDGDDHVARMLEVVPGMFDF